MKRHLHSPGAFVPQDEDLRSGHGDRPVVDIDSLDVTLHPVQAIKTHPVSFGTLGKAIVTVPPGPLEAPSGRFSGTGTDRINKQYWGISVHSEPADISRKVIALRELVCQGLANEVRLILVGASSYNALDDHESQRYPSAYEAHDEKGLHLMTFVMAHLERAVGGRGPSYHDEFERWLSDGAPGINLAQVDALRALGPSTL